MSREAALWLIFAAFFGAPIAVAVLLALLTRWMQAARRLARPRAGEALAVIEYGRRRLRCFRAAAFGLVAGVAALAMFALPLTAVALLVGGILYGLLVHLRCPRCNTAPGLQGVSVRGHCFRCGAWLG